MPIIAVPTTFACLNDGSPLENRTLREHDSVLRWLLAKLLELVRSKLSSCIRPTHVLIRISESGSKHQPLLLHVDHRPRTPSLGSRTQLWNLRAGCCSNEILRTRIDKVNAELVTLTYGTIVAQLCNDYDSNYVEVNKQLDRMGYNIGMRLIEDFFAKSGTQKCASFRETAETISKVRPQLDSQCVTLASEAPYRLARVQPGNNNVG